MFVYNHVARLILVVPILLRNIRQIAPVFPMLQGFNSSLYPYIKQVDFSDLIPSRLTGSREGFSPVSLILLA